VWPDLSAAIGVPKNSAQNKTPQTRKSHGT
jgi:hypothetical protein